MARIRTVKPSFFTSLTIADLSVEARLTFIGLWTHVDDDGRAVDDPRLVRAALWPLDDDVTAGDVDRWVGELAAAGLVHRYEVDGRRYLAVVTFGEHQKVSHPTPSTLPAPPLREASDATAPTPPEASVKPPEDSGSVPGRLRPERNGREGKGTLAPEEASGGEEQPQPRARTQLDDLKDALVVATGGTPDQVPRSRWSQINKLAAELRDLDATPDEIHARAKRYRVRFRDVALTPEALAKHWAALGPPAQRTPVAAGEGRIW